MEVEPIQNPEDLLITIENYLEHTLSFENPTLNFLLFP